MNIKTVVKENIQEIIVEKDGIEKTIYTLTRASKNNFCKYIEDMNYIIIYNDRRDQEGYHYRERWYSKDYLYFRKWK